MYLVVSHTYITYHDNVRQTHMVLNTAMHLFSDSTEHCVLIG